MSLSLKNCITGSRQNIILFKKSLSPGLKFGPVDVNCGKLQETGNKFLGVFLTVLGQF